MIHVLGAGNIGALMATALNRANIPVTLLLRQAAARRFAQADETIRIYTPQLGDALYETRFPAEVSSEPGPPISQLLIATKSWQAQSALKSVLPRLSDDAEICLIQNGLGVRKEIESVVKPSHRISEAVTSIGVKATGAPYTYVFSGTGSIVFSGTTSTVAAALEENPLLMVEQVPTDEFCARQHEKLVVNAVINPLTAILGCQNGQLPRLDYGAMQDIVNECCFVLAKWAETRDGATAARLHATLDPQRVLEVTVAVTKATAGNTSSMLADVDAGHRTEISYINGYILGLAKKLGISAPRNALLTQLVGMKQRQTRYELEHAFAPLA